MELPARSFDMPWCSAGVMEGKARKRRPCRDWTDDITDWCKEDPHTLRWKATDRTEWQRVLLDMQSTPAGHLAHGVENKKCVAPLL